MVHATKSYLCRAYPTSSAINFQIVYFPHTPFLVYSLPNHLIPFIICSLALHIFPISLFFIVTTHWPSFVDFYSFILLSFTIIRQNLRRTSPFNIWLTWQIGKYIWRYSFNNLRSIKYNKWKWQQQCQSGEKSLGRTKLVNWQNDRALLGAEWWLKEVVSYGLLVSVVPIYSLLLSQYTQVIHRPIYVCQTLMFKYVVFYNIFY